MSVLNYQPLIQDMTWSFSRIRTYEDCRYAWFLKYIKHCEEVDKFYASYGSFMHKLIAQYYQGEITADAMPLAFLTGFAQEVKGIRPKPETVRRYVDDGVKYLRGFCPLPFEPIGVEKRVSFQIDGIPFVGYIDYLGRRDDGLYIVDHKSRNLKPRSTRTKPTANDAELDDMLKQLYLYAAAVKQEYGVFPKALCFNCFRNGNLIEEPFCETAYREACQWAVDCVRRIEQSEDFEATRDFFSCCYLCDVSEQCIYDIEAREERRFMRI